MPSESCCPNSNGLVDRIALAAGKITSTIVGGAFGIKEVVLIIIKIIISFWCLCLSFRNAPEKNFNYGLEMTNQLHFLQA